MSYSVKEIFYTLQGEGANAGRAAVFCRFSGCNLWSGRESDRANAICGFCDTDFVGIDGVNGGTFAMADELTGAVRVAWKARSDPAVAPLIVCTGGEPLLQLDQKLVDSLHYAGFEIAIETNGTKFPPAGIDWICVSPKSGKDLVLVTGDELKLVYPQAHISPEMFERLDFAHFFLQPMDGMNRELNTKLAIEYCLENPKWRLSLQTHKIVGIP